MARAPAASSSRDWTPADPTRLGADDLTVRFDERHAPTDVVTVLDLDAVEDWDDVRLQELLAPRPDRALLVGLSGGWLPRAAIPVLSGLTFTLLGGPCPALEGDARLCVLVPDPRASIDRIQARTRRAPRAAFALDGLLRLTASAPPEDALVAESLAYSMLLGGPEFRAWRASRPAREVRRAYEPVRLTRRGEHLDVTLDEPERRNAFSAGLRAALVDALRMVALDDSIRTVRLGGAGPSFSSGGDLDEFGFARDLPAAHAMRLDQSAGLGVHRVAGRVTAELHGACIGAGIEVPAFASTVLARTGTTFTLPELGLGLVPGAGGTVSLPRRIGRWRTAYLVLSGIELGLDEALEWGLVDGVV